MLRLGAAKIFDYSPLVKFDNTFLQACYDIYVVSRDQDRAVIR
jgi:hypothetical protein